MTGADGYITEIPYVVRYHRELNPTILKLALALQGIAWDKAAPRYLELGCGFGLPALFNAAGNPAMSVAAVDINAEHIDTARGIARSAGLGNVRFIQAAFADLETSDLGELDFITLHGVWSWVNGENRAHILRFIDRHLAPGGIVYLSYNTLPGLASVLPLRELMRDVYEKLPGTAELRVDAGVKFAERMRKAGALYFSVNPRAALTLDSILPKSRNALAHEYFNADWTAFYHRDVERDFSPLGLSYAASAHLFDNIDYLNYPQAALALLHEQSPEARETLKDYLANREFRRDIFIRTPVVRANALDLLRRTVFASAGGPDGVSLVSGQTPLGKITVKPELGRRVLTALAGEPLSIEEICAHPACANLKPADVVETIIMLAAMNAAEPALPPATLAERKTVTDRLNAVLWEAAAKVDVIHSSISPVTGGGVGLQRIEQLFMLARAKREDPEGFLRSIFGAGIQGDVRANYAQFMEKRLPVLQKLGIG
ncbi:MAG: class I SAM-dependent methyltransferase [Candidatus Binataceae bacterium]